MSYLNAITKHNKKSKKTDGLFHPPTSEKSDMVNKPPHYNKANIECIKAIEAATDDGFQFYLQGNIIKYIWRYRYKNGIEDLKKADWYLKKLIKVLENAS
tara:strand:- start:1139 stop:1438 length:300 start_codon:yes stop_codon:yes gene_type:complete